MRSFVATRDEMAAIEAVIARPRFVNCQMLSVVVKTDPAWLRSVIPAPLEPDGDTIRFMVGRWQSNCVADFAGSGVYLPARLGSDVGEYVLSMYMDTDAAILYGREVFGEPKKQAASGTFRGGDIASGWVERHGARIIHLEANLTTDNGPVDTTGLNFNIKAQPACDGKGLEHDAVVTAADFEVKFNVNLSGTGAVRLIGTGQDPLDSIPLGDVVQSVWQEGDLYATTRRVATIPAADFAPYFYARVDDYALLDTESRVLA